MPKTLADGRILLTVLTSKPKNPAAPTLEELNAGKKISCRIMKSDYALGASGNSEITEQEMCKKGEGKAPGPASYEGSLTVFRYLEDSGKPSVEDDFAWDLLKKLGTELWLVEREGPDEAQPLAKGDIVSVYEVITNTPTKPGDRFAGYIKRTIKLSVTDAHEDVEVATGV